MNMSKSEEVVRTVVPRFSTLYRWRSLLLILLVWLMLMPIYHLRASSAVVYTDYVHKHMSKILNFDQWVYNNTIHNEGTKDVVQESYNFSSPCDNFPDTQGILLVMKTGATEAYNKLPTHFVTHMQCLSDFLLFSDMEQQIGKYHLYDALDRVDEAIRERQPEFSLYKAMHSCPSSQIECTEGVGDAWVLDKYKFLWMAVKTWEMRPGMDWYVFAEADSYIIWSNLEYWLRNKRDHNETQYLGSKAAVGNFPFAHGGSGFVLSGTLLKKIVTEIPNVGHKYDELAPTACCGDYLMALAANEVGSMLKNVWPMINGEKPSTLLYGPLQWCEPLLTMHHMNAEEISMVWQFEQTRKQEGHILSKELYHTFFAPHLVPMREAWSNLSNDKCYIAADPMSQNKATATERGRQIPEDQKNAVERHAHKGPEACSRVCEAEGLMISPEEYEALDTDTKRGELLRMKYREQSARDKDWHNARRCFQWTYKNGVCCTAWSFRLGMPERAAKEEDKRTSGWFVDGINGWIEAQGECEKPLWRDPI